MKANTENIKEEIRGLIEKSNALLNEGKNKQQATAYLYIIFSFIALSFFGLFAPFIFNLIIKFLKYKNWTITNYSKFLTIHITHGNEYLTNRPMRMVKDNFLTF